MVPGYYRLDSRTAVFRVEFYGTSCGSSGGSTAPSGSTARTSAVVPLWVQDIATLVSAAVPLGGNGSSACSAVVPPCPSGSTALCGVVQWGNGWIGSPTI